MCVGVSRVRRRPASRPRARPLDAGAGPGSVDGMSRDRELVPRRGSEGRSPGDVPDALDVTFQKGAHSAELDLGAVVIDIANARIKNYVVEGKAESWRVAGFDGVH